MKENLLLVVWGCSVIFSTLAALSGSLWFMLFAVVCLWSSWELLKLATDDDNDDYPDCLGV